MANKPPPAVGLTEIAHLLGVTTRQVANYRAEGMPHRSRGGRLTYVPSECVRWRLERARDEVRREVAPDREVEQARKLRAEADLKELELKERRGALVSVEDFEEQIDAVIAGLAAVASGQLQRFERRIVAATTAGQARKLTEAIHDALMEGAREYARQLEAEASALDDAEQESAEEPAA